MNLRAAAIAITLSGGGLAVLSAAACGPRSNAEDTPALSESMGLRLADSLVAKWVDSGTIPGAVLSVAEDGVVVFEKAYGVSQADPPVGMETTTVFDLASVTKVMATTFAVMVLVDRGEVELAAPVHDFLPDFVSGPKAKITVRHLLTHRAGLHPWQPTYYAAANADEAYAYIRDLPLLGPPGGERRYSDLGFMLLGMIVEEVSGQRLDAFLEAELYEPLGLTRTAFRPAGGPPARAPDIAATSHGNPFERRMVHDTTFGYRYPGDPEAWSGWRDHWLVGEVNDGNAYHAFNGVAGHAGLFSNAAELQKLLYVVANQGEGAAGSVVSPETLVAFLEEAVEGQALGWQVPDFAPVGSFMHTGFTGTWVIGVPSRGLTAVLLTNRQNHGVDDETRYPDIAPLQRSVGEALIGRS